MPDVPTAPGVPVAGGVTGASSVVSAPTSAVRFARSLAYVARHSVWVVISSLKFVMISETCVRASPVNCAASGSCVIWLSVSRASVRCRFAASLSTLPLVGAADGSVGVVGGGVVVGGCAGGVAGGWVAGGVAGG